MFLEHARGSLYELETQLELCDRVGYIDASPLMPDIEKTGRLINATIRTYAKRLNR